MLLAVFVARRSAPRKAPAARSGLAVSPMLLGLAGVAWVLWSGQGIDVWAQQPGPPGLAAADQPALPGDGRVGQDRLGSGASAKEKSSTNLAEAERRAAEALRAAEPPSTEELSAAAPATAETRLDYLKLTYQGGPLMIPIFLFSVLVVALAFERAITLRRGAILPTALVQALKGQCHPERGLDPREAYRLCVRFPSAAATAIRAMLLKADRPVVEMEQAGREAAEREADRLAGGNRWLALSAQVAPMLGLLGTVQGMILAFFKISTLPPGVSRAQELAASIYMALVTTFAGLCVAIPAAFLGHLYGGRLLRRFRELEEVLAIVVVNLERAQRRLRASKESLPSSSALVASPPAAGPVWPAPAAAQPVPPEPPPVVSADGGKLPSADAVRS